MSIFRIFIDKIQVSLSSDKIGGYFILSPVYVFEIIPLVLLGMRNVSDRNCTENQNTPFVFTDSSPPPPAENPAVYEIMWKNFVAPGRPQMTIWRMRIACRVTWLQTHTEYVKIIAFPPETVVARTRLNVMLYVHCLSCITDTLDVYCAVRNLCSLG